MSADSKPSRGRFAWGLLTGFLLTLGWALAGALLWTSGWVGVDVGEPRALRDLRARLEAQERHSAEVTQRTAGSREGGALEVRVSTALARMEERYAALEKRQDGEQSDRRRRAEEERAEERARIEKALQAAQAESTLLREELARTKQACDSLRDDLLAEADTREQLESHKAELLERALTAELRLRERDAFLAHAAATNSSAAQAPAAPLVGPSQPPSHASGAALELLGSSSPWMTELAQSLPPELLRVAAPATSTEGAINVQAERSENRQPALDAQRDAEVQSQQLAARQAQIEALRSDANRLLELDGYGEWQFVRIGSIEGGQLRDVALAERGALGANRRFVVADELRFEAFSGLRSLRLLMKGGYEQEGSAAAQPFADAEREITWADVRLNDWRALLDARGLWQERGEVRSGAPDARYSPAETLTALNAIFARAQGSRRFILRRLDHVLEGPRLQGIELHQMEIGGGGLQVIYEAEAAELWWDPVQKTAELRLEHGFQRRGNQRVPFFDQRSRVFLSFEQAETWNAESIPFHLAATASR